MPGSYAHYKLGVLVFELLPSALREGIEEYRELYDIGLHGPDILFYNSPLIPNKVNKLGRETHYSDGEKVFKEAWENVCAHDGNPMYMAYIYGYLCHFALDSMCHGYVRTLSDKGPVGHHEIEMEFDRMLMVDDGLDPIKYDLTRHIVPSVRNAAVISSFFAGISAQDVSKSLISMKYYIDFLRMPDGAKRKVVLGAFKLSGHYRKLKGFVMSLKPNPQCDESNRRLLELFYQTVPLAVRLITEFHSTMIGELPLDDQYRFDFESEDHSGELKTN